MLTHNPHIVSQSTQNVMTTQCVRFWTQICDLLTYYIKSTPTQIICFKSNLLLTNQLNTRDSTMI